MIDWPIDLAQGIQHRLIQNNVTEPQPLFDTFRIKKELLNSDVFELLLPQQPGLLTCLILFGMITVIFFVLFGVFCVARYLGTCGSELYQVCVSWIAIKWWVTFSFQKHPTKLSKFFGLSIGFAVNWVILALCVAFIVTCILRLGNGGRSMIIGAEDVPVHIQISNVIDTMFKLIPTISEEYWGSHQDRL